jgi:KTSC domain
MVREAVESRAILSIGYDKSSAVLEIEFTNGSIYQYERVPACIADEFMQANSKGEFFNACIKDGYDFIRIR